MEFKKAYKSMKDGKKIKRPFWGGYWKMKDPRIGDYNIVIKLQNGNSKEDNFTQETILNIMANDWEIVK